MSLGGWGDWETMRADQEGGDYWDWIEHQAELEWYETALDLDLELAGALVDDRLEWLE